MLRSIIIATAWALALSAIFIAVTGAIIAGSFLFNVGPGHRLAVALASHADQSVTGSAEAGFRFLALVSAVIVVFITILTWKVRAADAGVILICILGGLLAGSFIFSRSILMGCILILVCIALRAVLRIFAGKRTEVVRR